MYELKYNKYKIKYLINKHINTQTGGSIINIKLSELLSSSDIVDAEISDIVSISDAEKLANWLKTNNTLKKLTIRFNKIDSAGLNKISNNIEKLDTLNIEDNNLHSTGIMHICSALKVNNNMTTLDLCGNNIGDTGAHCIGSMLETNKTLKILDLSDNNIGHIGAKALATGITNNVHLEILNMHNNKLGGIGCNMIGYALAKNNKLKNLQMSQNIIDDVLGLNTGLQTNTILETLILFHNNIGDNIINFDPNKLKVLDLNTNDITDIGALALTNKLETNTYLQSLDLSHNKISEVVIKQIFTKLNKNKTLYKLDFSYNNILNNRNIFLLIIHNKIRYYKLKMILYETY